MDLLIFVFTFFAGFGALIVAFAPDPPRQQSELVSLKDLVSRQKLGTYLFLIFFLVSMLQINTDFSGTAADLSIATVMVTMAIAALVIFLLYDLSAVLVFTAKWLNSRR